MRELRFTRQAEKSLDKLVGRTPEIARMLAGRIGKLRAEPPRGARSLDDDLEYRVRVGNYRVIYRFDDETLIVTIIDKRDKTMQRLKNLPLPPSAVGAPSGRMKAILIPPE